jgi:hypothetical protein
MSGERGEGGADLRELLHRQEKEDLGLALEAARRRERRHWGVAAFGVSPSVIAVSLGLWASGQIALLLFFSVLVAGVEGWRAQKASQEAHDIERRLEELARRSEDRPLVSRTDGTFDGNAAGPRD